MAARMAVVVVVPIFEPKDNGYALSMLMTPIPIHKKEALVQTYKLLCIPVLSEKTQLLA